MSHDLHLSGPTVTVFGRRDALGEAIDDELGRRGCSTHVVTTPLGWLSSTTSAVVRLGTPSGERALLDLASHDAPATHVVAVCEKTQDAATTARLSELCRRSSERHDVSLIWHAPLELQLESLLDGLGPQDTAAPDDLAVTIADEVGHQVAWTSAPSFAEQTFDPGRHRARPGCHRY